MDNNNPEIFIAYRSFDLSAAELLARRLRAEGIETWLDRLELKSGDNWNDALQAALEQCRVCLILIGADTPESNINDDAYNIRSDENRIEPGGSLGLTATLPNSGMLQAIERRLSQGHIRVIPVFLPGTSLQARAQLPAFIKNVPWIEFPQSLDDKQAFLRLLAVIRGELPAVSEMSPVLAKLNAVEKGRDSFQARVSTRKTIRLPDIDWVEIPAGSFIYGEKNNQQRLELERFFISRYPITNSQYLTFIDAGGYQDEPWWQDLIKPEPAEPYWKQPNRPRETVD